MKSKDNQSTSPPPADGAARDILPIATRLDHPRTAWRMEPEILTLDLAR